MNNQEISNSLLTLHCATCNNVFYVPAKPKRDAEIKAYTVCLAGSGTCETVAATAATTTTKA